MAYRSDGAASVVERLQSVVQAANQRWAALAENERRTDPDREPLPVPEPLAVLCAEYAKSASILHDEAASAAQAGFGQLAEVATELAEELDEFVRIACPPPVS